jgi:hypothetical protein
MDNPCQGSYGRASFLQPVPPSRRKRPQIAKADPCLMTCEQSIGTGWQPVCRLPNTKAVRKHLASAPGNYRLVAADGTIAWSKLFPGTGRPVLRDTFNVAPKSPPKPGPQRINTSMFAAPAAKVVIPSPRGIAERHIMGAGTLNAWKV